MSQQLVGSNKPKYNTMVLSSIELYAVRMKQNAYMPEKVGQVVARLGEHALNILGMLKIKTKVRRPKQVFAQIKHLITLNLLSLIMNIKVFNLCQQFKKGGLFLQMLLLFCICVIIKQINEQAIIIGQHFPIYSIILLLHYKQTQIFYPLETKGMIGQKEQTYPNHNIQNYRACMVLAAVGDAMGYKNGDWEFLTNGAILHEKMMELTQNKGPLALKISLQWRYSDDTVMHIATALALTNKEIKTKGKNKIAINEICKNMGIEYKKCWQRMSGRAPGKTTGKSIMVLNEDGSNWDKIPFNDRACGCGASMRSACIGLAFYDNVQRLIAISIQSGRLTHHNPAAYLASMMSSYFTALAIKGVQPHRWLSFFLVQAMPLAQNYIKTAGREVKANIEGQNWAKFIKSVQQYAKKRSLALRIDQQNQPKFPEKYGVIERQHFYHQISWGRWPGALGIDSVLIAYDALLSSKDSWEQLCLRGILHGGDNDSTGTIAGAWFGAYYGFKGVPKNHYQELEDGTKLKYLGEQLFSLV